jgi:hypothetical protein
VKPAYLKGLSSVSTTSSKPLPYIQEDIIRVLDHLGVEWEVIKGGFSCQYTFNPGQDVHELTPQDRLPEAASETTSVRVKNDIDKGGVLYFEILIVKLILFSRHNIKFKVADRQLSQYEIMAKIILSELRV